MTSKIQNNSFSQCIVALLKARAAAAFVAVSAVGCSAALAADDLGFVVTGGSPSGNSNDSFLGYEFVVSAPTRISGLGIVLPTTTTTSNSHVVSLFAAGSYTALATTTVTAGESVNIGNAVINAITPVSLAAGHYWIGAHYDAGDYSDLMYASDSVFTPAAGITWDSDRVSIGTLDYSNTVWTSTTQVGYFGPNFTLASPMSDIDTALPSYAASALGSTVNPAFAGGVLLMDQAAATYNQNFTLSSATTNTIDQYGNGSTFTGVFSDLTTGGSINIVNSATGGSVTFTGVNTYTGSTTIGSGATLVLTGAGSIASSTSVTNHGTFDVSGATGSPSLAGSFVQSSSGHLVMSVAPGTVQSLHVGGAATLDGTLQLDVGAGSYAYGRYTLVSAASVTGQFATVSALAPGWNILYSSNDVELSIGPDGTNTRAVLTSNASILRSILDRRAGAVALATNYDCASFGANRFCMSFQAGSNRVGSTDEGAGTLIGAYRFTDTIRVGAFVEYRDGGTSSATVRFNNDLPTFGAFAAYSETVAGTGFQAKISAAVQIGGATITRNASLAATEPGSGYASLNAYASSTEIGYGVDVAPSMVATPFVGTRVVEAARGGYSEALVPDTVAFPVHYDRYAERLIAAFTGVHLSGTMGRDFGYEATIALEKNAARSVSAFAGTSQIVGLERFALVQSTGAKEIRGVGSLGLFYRLDANQRLTGSVARRSEAVTGQATTAVRGGYQVAF